MYSDSDSVIHSSLNRNPNPRDLFLVCGLGHFGQHCVVALKEFGVSVIAIEKSRPRQWELPQTPEILDDLIYGDCRIRTFLEKARIDRCRAALLVTSDEQVNIETALAIRRLNPHTRLVVRSGTNNLNYLLGEQLGNFIAYEPTELPANAFALGALGSEILGLFKLDGHWFQVIDRPIDNRIKTPPLQQSPWHTHLRRILFHLRANKEAESLSTVAFHQWQPEASLYLGDRLIYIEASDQLLFHPKLAVPEYVSPNRRKIWLYRCFEGLKKQLRHFLELSFQQQIRRVAIVCGCVVLSLLGLSTVLYKIYYQGISLASAFYASVVLLLGGYGDIFGDDLIAAYPLPWWLKLFSLGLTLAGTAFVGVLYALLTEMLLSTRFQLIKRRPSVPTDNHVVIIGLSRLGQNIATLLQSLQQSIVGVSFNPNIDDTELLPDVPLIVGSITDALNKANLATATSIVVVTDDEMRNLEVALMAGRINPYSHLVIQTDRQHLSEHLQEFLPHAQVIENHSVAAEVFAGAAFGENIINLFRLNNRTILVTEYQIEENDTLNGLILADIAYGYGVIPILHQRPPHNSLLMPPDEIRLEIGDRLVVLATIEGLQCIEVGKKQPKDWQIVVKNNNNTHSLGEIAKIIAHITGFSPKEIQEAMAHFPQSLSIPVYRHQGYCLLQELKKIHINVSLLPITHEVLDNSIQHI